MKIGLPLLLFLLLSVSISAQLPRVMLRNYTTDQGLASSEVQKIYQDHLGYQWIGTDNGISCFNGYEFKNYGPLDGLEDPVVLQIDEDTYNSLWVCTLSGWLFKKVGNRFIPHSKNKEIVEKTKGKNVQSFMIDGENTFYIGIVGIGILVLKNNEVNWLSEKNENFQLLKKGSKFAYASIGNASQNNHLSILNYSDNHLFTGVDSSFNFKISSLSRACIYGKDTILLCNEAKFFVIYQNKLQKVFTFKKDINNIYAIKNDIYISFNNSNGLKKYKGIQNLSLDNGVQILSNFRGGGVVEDRNKLLWINTIDNGIYLMPNENIKIYDQHHFGGNEYITSIANIDDASSYVLLRNGSVYYINIENNNIKNIYKSDGALGYNNLNYIPEQKKLFYLNSKSDYLTYYDNKWLTMNEQQFGYQTYYKNGSKYLIITNHLGFNILDIESKKSLFDSNNNLPSVRTLCVLESSDNRIFIGNVNGLFEFKNEKLTAIKMDNLNQPIRIEALAELKDGTLVIGTKGRGVILKKEDKTTILTTANRLTSDMIECLHVDNEDNIWVGTQNGLNKLAFKKGNWEIANYSTATGLPSNEINTIKASNNILWIGTPKGLAIIDKNKYFLENNYTKPIIEKIEINNNPIEYFVSNTFSYNNNNIQLQYITLAYQKFGNILYRYRFDENESWITTTDKRITYIAQEGNHRFEIQSQNENNTWSESTYWNFKINAPWWKSWLFIVSAAFVLIGAAYSYYLWRIRQLKNNAKIEKEKVQLQNRALQAQMNPHFLFNCLNSIQNLIVIGKTDYAADYLSKFARLVRNVLNTSNKDKITLESDLILLNNYLELEKIRFGDKLNYEIRISDSIDQYDIMIPPLLIQPFVENAIIHGIAPLTDNKGMVEIIYTMINNKLDIQIIDNGIGLNQSIKSKEKQDDRISYGIETSKQRIKLLETNHKTFFMMSEILDSEGNPTGTKINIQIPV